MIGGGVGGLSTALPPDEARPDRHGAARSGRAGERHHLARGGALHPVQRLVQPHGPAEVQRRAVPGARGGDGPAGRLPQDGIAAPRRVAGSARRVLARRRRRRPPRRPVRAGVARAGRGAVSVRAARRSAGRGVPADRRLDRSDEPGERVREGRNRRGARASTAARRSRRSARTAGGWRLETPAGDVLAGTVVLAAGQWSRELARRVGAVLPIVSMPHHYVITEAVPGLRAGDDSLPVLRDPAASFYARQDNEGMVVGPFEHDVDPVGAGRHPLRVPRPPSAARVAADPPVSRDSCRADTRAVGDTGQEDDSRPRRVHPGRTLPARPGARPAGFPCRLRLLDLRHRLVGRRGTLCGRVDRRRPAERQHVGGRRRALRRLRRAVVHRRAGGRGLPARVRHPLSRRRSGPRAGR